MSTFQPINPKPFLKSLIGKQVIVRLKWNKTEYRGTLISIDNYMNLQLDQTYEIIYENDQEPDNKNEELIGEIFIRCNNVLFIRQAKEDSEKVDLKANAQAEKVEVATEQEQNGDENESKKEEMETD
ncbi:Small nuclear ribonucleoprotein F [Spathaspora sp. JA1]|nr:Small nuclear ribonucleoprotein F [Spathaspora sp. JA1]